MGGLIAGGLGAALAALAELLVWTAPDRTRPPGRSSIRIIAAAFIGGELVMGLVIILLTLFEGGTVEPIVGFASSALIGLGSFGIALAYRRYAGAPGQATDRERSVVILRMALAQGIGILGAILAILTLMLSPV